MLSVKNTTNLNYNDPAFEKIKSRILGKEYELSLVLCADTLIKKLSLQYKGNLKHTNVLSFPISDSEGEIFINIREAQRKYKNESKKHILFLFIHACLHLAGEKHSKKMEHLEDKLCKEFIS